MSVRHGHGKYHGHEHERNGEEGGRPDLIGAAEQHVMWKTHLGHHVRGAMREPVESALIGQDCICQLAVWINGEEFDHLRETGAYAALDSAHQLFHQLGGDIVQKLQQGDREGAEDLFHNDYSLAMINIIKALADINSLFEAHEKLDR